MGGIRVDASTAFGPTRWPRNTAKAAGLPGGLGQRSSSPTGLCGTVSLVAAGQRFMTT